MTEVSASILGSEITSATIEQAFTFKRHNVEYTARAQITKTLDAAEYHLTAFLDEEENCCYETRRIAKACRAVKPSDNVEKLATELLEWLESVVIAKLKERESSDNG